jgi:hypothetical protein
MVDGNKILVSSDQSSLYRGVGFSLKFTQARGRKEKPVSYKINITSTKLYIYQRVHSYLCPGIAMQLIELKYFITQITRHDRHHRACKQLLYIALKSTVLNQVFS